MEPLIVFMEPLIISFDPSIVFTNPLIVFTLQVGTENHAVDLGKVDSGGAFQGAWSIGVQSAEEWAIRI